MNFIKLANRNTLHRGFLFAGTTTATLTCRSGDWRGDWQTLEADPLEVYAPLQLCRTCFRNAPPRLPPPIPGDAYDVMLRAAYASNTCDDWLILADWLEEQGDPACEALRFACGDACYRTRTQTGYSYGGKAIIQHANDIRRMRLVPRKGNEAVAIFFDTDKNNAVILI